MLNAHRSEIWTAALLFGICLASAALADENTDTQLLGQSNHAEENASDQLRQSPIAHRKIPLTSPLARAAFSGNTDAIRELLQAGTKPDSQSVVAAVWSRKIESVQLLLKAGAEPSHEAMDTAAAIGDTELVLLFLNEGVPPNAGFARAAGSGRLELAKLLLGKGAQVNHKVRGGTTALHSAASQQAVEPVRFLLQHGADPNITNERDETPLHRAIEVECNLEIIKLLVQAGAKLNIPNNEGVTPVRLAAIRWEREAYDFLLAAAGGTEPLPVGEPGDRSTAELIPLLKSKEREVRIAAQRELVLRGKVIVPEVLQSIEGGAGLEYFCDLFQVMGPEAEDAVPLLEAQLIAGSKYVWIAAVTIEVMNPGALAELDEDAKQKLAKAFYEGATDPGADVMAGPQVDMLLQLGSEAVPFFLQGLRHDEPRVRELMAESLEISRYADATLQAELIKLLREDPRPRVRAGAASALGNPTFRSKAAKDALLDAWRHPPHWREPTDYGEYQGAERTKRHQNYLWNSEVSNFNTAVPPAIAAYGPEVIDDLLPSVLAADEVESQRLAAPWKYLGADAVESLLQHEDERVRKIADRQLARLQKEGKGTKDRASKRP